MSEHITADLGSHSHDIEDFERVLYHVGDASAPLNRWRKLLQSVSPRGWSAVKKYAADVMKLIAQPRVLFTAAVALRAPGPKAPGPNNLRLEWLTIEELWEMCTVLGKAIDSDTYRPGKERVHWVQKMSGSGKRPIVLSDVQDRVVQKAAALVLRSMLDPLFDPLSFAFRPLRRREQAIAVAEKLATGGYPVWLTHDLKDAFCRVPLSRLLDVVFKLLPCPRLRAFLGRILPPQSRRLRGIKQGGPLSPLMLELYLTHFLHQPWRKAGHDVRIVRYADDLLLAVARITRRLRLSMPPSANCSLPQECCSRRSTRRQFRTSGRNRLNGWASSFTSTTRSSKSDSGSMHSRNSLGDLCWPTPNAARPSAPSKF